MDSRVHGDNRLGFQMESDRIIEVLLLFVAAFPREDPSHHKLRIAEDRDPLVKVTMYHTFIMSLKTVWVSKHVQWP